MSTVGERIKELRERRQMSQTALGKLAGVTKEGISAIERGTTKNPKPKTLYAIADALNVSDRWLMEGGNSANARESQLKAVEWESESELDSDTYVLAPLLEIELAAGEGTVVQNEQEQYRLPIRRYTLRKQGVSPESVRMVRVLGDSMEDKISDDSVVAINTEDKRIRDGKIYAYSDCDLLKVKYLHPMPGGGLRIRSHNQAYPDEILTAEQVKERIVIHGRVFMISSLC